MTDLPPSLAVIPNIPVKDQTDEQLILEGNYWQQKIDKATEWGAAVSAAHEFLLECRVELRRRIHDNP